MSNYLITIDPGLRGLGLAVFEKQTLVKACYVKNEAEGRGYAAHVELAKGTQSNLRWAACGELYRSNLLVEMPRVYPVMPKTDLNDLLDLSGVGGAVAAKLSSSYGCAVEHVFPSDWKGQLEKQAMVARIKGKLSEAERAVVEPAASSLMHNVYDAIGIGLWKLGRLNKKVYPGIEE